MFQSFTATTRPEDGPRRLASLRARMADQGLAGFLVPRADAHQGEYVAERDQRLAWLTGFTGSAGFAAVLKDRAGLFVDGRYRLQVRSQCDLDHFSPVHWPETSLEDWLTEALPQGGAVGYDPWLHTASEISRLKGALATRQIVLRPVDNLVDAIWEDRPDAPAAPVTPYPERLSGVPASDKRAEIATGLREAGQTAAVLTLPDSIAWLLNIRGGDLTHLPVAQAFAVIEATGAVAVYSDTAKFVSVDLGPEVTLNTWSEFDDGLRQLAGPVRVDPATAPQRLFAILEEAGIAVAKADDPCILPKARKSEDEISATREAHLRDGAAVARFLHWFDTEASGGTLTEIACATALEGFRADTGALRDISFDTIAGAGAHGAIVHYRVTEQTDARLNPGQLFLIDSGGQYEDGTTDITRTLPVGHVGATERTAFTQVLRGMIAIHRARFPEGVAGRDLDALARAPLWSAGRDYDHGTGHGVGVYLGVHEGPQRISRASTVPLEPGMILSNEPGYYRQDAFGIRLENLIVVEKAPPVDGGDDRAMLRFETLTFAPIHRDLIDTDALNEEERNWLNTYHAAVLEKIGPRVEEQVLEWLKRACAPL